LVFISGFLKLEGKERKVHVFYLLPFLLKLVCFIVSWFKRHRWRLLQGRKNKTHPTPPPLQSFTDCVARGLMNYDDDATYLMQPKHIHNKNQKQIEFCCRSMILYWWFCIGFGTFWGEKQNLYKTLLIVVHRFSRFPHCRRFSTFCP
jgi:hypothetical protein